MRPVEALAGFVVLGAATFAAAEISPAPAPVDSGPPSALVAVMPESLRINLGEQLGKSKRQGRRISDPIRVRKIAP